MSVACNLGLCVPVSIVTYQILNSYRQRLWKLFARVFCISPMHCESESVVLSLPIKKAKTKVAGINRVIPRTFPSSLVDNGLLAGEGNPSNCVSITMKGR